MKRRLGALVATAAVIAVVPAAAPILDNSPIAPASAVAKTCAGGSKHAVINGAEKCLRRGQFCAHAADRQYRRYGFRCTRFDGGVGRYRLS